MTTKEISFKHYVGGEAEKARCKQCGKETKRIVWIKTGINREPVCYECLVKRAKF